MDKINTEVRPPCPWGMEIGGLGGSLPGAAAPAPSGRGGAGAARGRTPRAGAPVRGRASCAERIAFFIHKSVFVTNRAFWSPQVVESTRVGRHKSAMAQRWEAGLYVRDED